MALAACGWLFASSAGAVTLGQPRGTLLIGRPLDLSLPVTLDAPDADGACSSAEVFYGDARVGAAPEVRWLPGPNGREGTLRIVASAPIDEPTVTVNLRVGCGASSASRRYVLLPDVPRAADMATVFPGQRAVAPALPTVAAPAPPRTQAAPPAAAPARARTEAAAAPAPAARAAAPRPSRGDSRGQSAPPAPSATGSRLRLTPLEPGPERDPVLHFSTELGLPAPGDAAKRAAAAALWQALNKTPEEAMQEGLKLQALDREIQSLRQVTQQNSEAVTTMRAQVQAARSDRNHVSTLALLLLALVLAVLGWVGWRLYQSRRLAGVTRWFEANQKDAEDSLSPAPAKPVKPAAAQPAMPGVARITRPSKAGLPPLERHLETAPLDVAAARAAIAGWAASESPAGEFQASQGGTVRTVGVRELLDVHDKADFFLSIGQHEQAIAVLEAHVHDQVETSALPWLDLLELYHSLGRRQDFETLRSEFRQRFTAQVPDFDHFDEPTSSLENYSRALSRIVALWPSRRVLEIIEESMFRKPGLPGADTFSLEAYRELVLLYHIAQEVAPPEYAEHVHLDEPAPHVAAHSEFSATSMQSLTELDRPELDLDVPLDLDDLAPAPHSIMAGAVPDGTLAWGDPHAADRDPLFIPPASPRLGLDIDLTDASDPTSVLPEGGRELPPLDFDTSEFEADPARDPTRRS